MTQSFSPLTKYLNTLNLGTNNLSRASTLNGGVTYFSLFDLEGSSHINYGEVYKQVYFSTIAETIYKIYYEGKEAIILNTSTKERKILGVDAILFSSGYYLEVAHPFKIAFFKYTDKITEIAPYFNYKPGVPLDTEEISLLKKIEAHLGDLNKKDK